MKKLIVVNEHEAPADKVFALLKVWASLATLLDSVINLPSGFHLSWELIIQMCEPNDRPSDKWEAYCTVTMVFPAKVGEIKNQIQWVEVPVTNVQQIMLYEDNGTFCWHSECEKPEDNLETIGMIAKALVKGKLPSGHHFEYNWIPKR